jgi:hypothetical protein
MSMGRGSVYSTSTKQKLVTRSLTECELVGVRDLMPQIEWTKLCLQEQGCTVQDTILYQDNMSAMLLEKKGRASSSSKRTKHINLRYFYVKDKVDKCDISIEHCPTKDMLADFFTKPLQGSLFFKQHDRVVNIDPNSKFHSCHRSGVLDHETSPVPRVQTKEKEPRNCNSCSSIMLIDHQVQREKNSVMTSPKNQDRATEMEPG